MSIVQRLTENIVSRDLQKEGAALLNKWEKTGLLEGLDNEVKKNGMARLLENQAKELLREASTMTAGDVEGFAAVAFPIVRRVFGGLIANDLVSVQPMSLPSGLIFFLDFKYNTSLYGASSSEFSDPAPSASSIYGGGAVGSQITGGVTLGDSSAETSFYALNQGYSSPTGSSRVFSFAGIGPATGGARRVIVASGTIGSGTGDDADEAVTAEKIGGGGVKTSLSKLVRYDPDLEGKAAVVCVQLLNTNSAMAGLNRNDLISITPRTSNEAGTSLVPPAPSPSDVRMVRRLTSLVGASSSNKDATVNALGLEDINTGLLTVWVGASSSMAVSDISNSLAPAGVAPKSCAYKFVRRDTFQGGVALGSVLGDLLNLEGSQGGTANAGGDDTNAESDQRMTEIDIKVDSIAVVATTKKLKAKWTPELGQDLNAYHNLDAEVELTSVLSEQIALEIDREILNDLVKGATTRLYWSRNPGKFVNRTSGKDITNNGANLPDFTGTVSEWYETLIETINDVSAQIHRKTLRGGANFVVVSPEVANVLEFTAGFRASVTADTDKGSAGALKVGALNSKFEVYVDPYFPRNVVLVGRKGSSFLESGYVYAPYVPLQVTPTIFGTEDFVPRKGVMTRYAKKMVRPDMYGVVVVQDLVG